MIATLLEFLWTLRDLIVDGFVLAFVIAAFAVGLSLGAVTLAATIGVLAIAWDLIRLLIRLPSSRSARRSKRSDGEIDPMDGSGSDRP